MAFPFPTDERREYPRPDRLNGCRVSVDGRMATLLNFSYWGAAVACPRTAQAGETIRLDLPESGPVRAVVLERGDAATRVRFDWPIVLEP